MKLTKSDHNQDVKQNIKTRFRFFFLFGILVSRKGGNGRKKYISKPIAASLIKFVRYRESEY